MDYPHHFLADNHLIRALKKREAEDALRKLTLPGNRIDFCSNDYMGMAAAYSNNVADTDFGGSTGSRLLSGNSVYAEELENYIAEFHHAEAALLYNSGYDANVGLISSVAGENDTIIYDELVHASIHDGMKLSKSRRFRFRHNNLQNLEERLNQVNSGTVFIVVESVYSMDGNFAPLEEMAAMTSKYKACLIVDEAHATGIFGNRGEGRVVQLKLEDKVFARVHTYGKAMGCHGAAVLGSRLLKDYQVNFSRSFIYTTALPQHSLRMIQTAYEKLESGAVKPAHLFDLIGLFKSNINKVPEIRLTESFSPIQCVVFPGNRQVKELAMTLQEKGYEVRPILSPTVPKNKERLRICIHEFNTEEQILGLCDEIQKNIIKLASLRAKL